MLDSINFFTLLAGEVILILAILAGLLLLYVRKLRQRHELLIAEYRKLHQSVHVALASSDSGQHDPLAKDGASPDPIDIFLTSASKNSLARFSKFTQAKIPRLSPELPFSAKVAALRYLYTAAEIEIHKQKTTYDEGWMLFEKKLAEILRWVASPKKLTPVIPNSQLRLLQEKLDVLKPFEAENAKLQKQLEQTLKKQKKLEDLQHDSKETLEKLQRIIHVLQLANSYKGENINSKVKDALSAVNTNEHWTVATGNYQASIISLDNISDISERKYSLVRKLVDELPTAYADLTLEQHQKMKDSIRLLEKDLQKSDYHMTNLQKELKAAKNSMLEKPLVITEKPVTPFNRYSVGKETLIHPLPTDPRETATSPTEETLTIVHTNQPAEEQHTETGNEWIKQGGHQRTLAEIQHLRTNNQSQRNIIIDLEKELRSLRHSMHETTDELERSEKGKDILRLERLVKECEHCIETLESEVDLLHKQLEQTSTTVAPENKPQHDIELLNHELETISSKLQRTIKQYSETAITNRFAIEALECDSIETLAKLLIKTVKELHISAGFYLNSSLGQAEYYAGNSFTPAEQKLVKQPTVSAPVSYLNEGILFAKPGLRLMLRNPPDDDDEQMQLENTLGNMINISAAQIKHLEVDTVLQRQSRNLNTWVDETKRQLTEIDIQYAYQTEESQRIVDNLVKELQHSFDQMEVSENTRTVIENAVSECYQRLNLLLDKGKARDISSSQLITRLDKLRPHKN